MKTQRKHGFTIVELVVVIAVIAILAAVLIPTFVSIIKKANDSAYVQERQSRRIDDIAQKIDNETWVSWEDMEIKISNAIAGISSNNPTKTEVEDAIKKAIEDYAAAHQSGNTGVTPEQVQKIVEETTKGNVTLEQVQALIAKIPTGSTGVTTAQVQAIVNQALAGVSASAGLNATQVNNLIKSYLESHPTGNDEAIKKAVEDALANVKTLSEEDVVAIVNNITNQMNDVTKVLTGVEDNGAGYTSVDNDKVIYLITNRSSTQQYTITSKAGQKVVIDAPNMTNVVVAGKSDEVVVFRTAMTSVHIIGTVGKVEINSGHVEIESDATVTTVTAAPSTNATVKVTVKTDATLTNPVDAEYQDHGRGTDDTIIVVIENGATVNGDNPKKVVLSASEELKKSEITTTNVRVTNGDTTPSTSAVVADDDVKEVLANADVEVVVNDGDSQTVDTNGNLVPRDQVQSEPFTVTFDTKYYNVNVASQQFNAPGKVTKPSDPEKEGYLFRGWFADYELTIPFDFENAIVSEDTTIYALWRVPVGGTIFYIHEEAVGNYTFYKGTSVTDCVVTNNSADFAVGEGGDLNLFVEVTGKPKDAIDKYFVYDSTNGAIYNPNSRSSGCMQAPTQFGYGQDLYKLNGYRALGDGKNAIWKVFNESTGVVIPRVYNSGALVFKALDSYSGIRDDESYNDHNHNTTWAYIDFINDFGNLTSSDYTDATLYKDKEKKPQYCDEWYIGSVAELMELRKYTSFNINASAWAKPQGGDMISCGLNGMNGYGIRWWNDSTYKESNIETWQFTAANMCEGIAVAIRSF